jgi:hypothetical protein
MLTLIPLLNKRKTFNLYFITFLVDRETDTEYFQEPDPKQIVRNPKRSIKYQKYYRKNICEQLDNKKNIRPTLITWPTLVIVSTRNSLPSWQNLAKSWSRRLVAASMSGTCFRHQSPEHLHPIQLPANKMLHSWNGAKLDFSFPRKGNTTKFFSHKNQKTMGNRNRECQGRTKIKFSNVPQFSIFFCA